MDNQTSDMRELVLARMQNSDIMPIMTPDELEDRWNEYREMENRILQDDDYIYFVEYITGGKKISVTCVQKKQAEKVKRDLEFKRVDAEIVRRKKKSAYRKMARFFGLFVPEQDVADVSVSKLGESHFVQVEKGKGVTVVAYMDENLNTIKVEVTVAIVAPNGKTSVGVGACSSEERSFTHSDHDIRSTAWTRAVNRGISDLIGWGEVSAEEVLPLGSVGGSNESAADSSDDDVVEGVAKPVSSLTLADFLARAFVKGWTMDKIVERFGELSKIDSLQGVLDVIEKEDEGE
jgi:hypothetical protein